MRAVWEEFRQLDVSRKALRSFGLLVGAVLMALFLFLAWRQDWEPGWIVHTVGGLGCGLLVFGLALPELLRPVYRGWMLMALVLGFIMTRILLTVVYFLVVTPIGLLRRIMGGDPMQRSFDQDTYWISRPPTADAPGRLEKYY